MERIPRVTIRFCEGSGEASAPSRNWCKSGAFARDAELAPVGSRDSCPEKSRQFICLRSIPGSRLIQAACVTCLQDTSLPKCRLGDSDVEVGQAKKLQSISRGRACSFRCVRYDFSRIHDVVRIQRELDGSHDRQSHRILPPRHGSQFR